MNKILTINQLSEALKCDYAVASSLVKIMVAQGVCKTAGKVAVEGKKGKPSTLYDVPATFSLSLFEVDKAEVKA
jgi:hypothetical protein